MQTTLFADAPTRRVRTGNLVELIDARHVERFRAEYRYRLAELAHLLDCDTYSLLPLVQARRWRGEKRIDARHWLDFDAEKYYSLADIARRLNCSERHVRRLEARGRFPVEKLVSRNRVPGWAVRSLICEMAAPPADHRRQLEFLALGSWLKRRGDARALLVVPGWSIIEYIERNCTRV